MNTPTADEMNIAFGDFETTGLMENPETVPLEVAFIVTDQDLNEMDSFGPVIIAATEEQLAGMNDFVREMHTKTGLIGRIRSEGRPLEEVEDDLLAFLQPWFPAKEKGVCRGAVLAGNSVAFDAEVITKFFPKIRAMMDYRVLDVSSIGQAVKRFNPEVYADMPPKLSDHTAMVDIRECLKELAYYRDNAFAAG